MVYGNFARSLGNEGVGNFKEQVSESDAVLEFLMNECNNYNNLFVNESFVDDKERIIAEAKMQVLTEAVGTAIIIALIAVLTAIIAFIVKFISMSKKAGDSISKAFKDAFNIKEPTAEQLKSAHEKIDNLVNNLNYNGNKEKLKNFSDLDFVNGETIKSMENLFSDLLHKAQDIINSILSVENIISKSKSVNDELMKIESDLKTISENENPFFDLMVRNSGNPFTSTDPKSALTMYKSIKEFYIDNGYFKKCEAKQTKINDDASKLKTYLEQNQKKFLAKLHPDNHIGESDNYTKAFQQANAAFRSMKDCASYAQKIMTKWAQAEQFRKSYVNIIISTMNG